MARPAHHIRQGDITFWGLFTLLTWTVAVLGANISAFFPTGVLNGLHASRLEGAGLAQLRMQVADLERELTALRQDNAVLVQRFTLGETESGDLTRRVAALELTVPRIY